jgi:hypothetical protein
MIMRRMMVLVATFLVICVILAMVVRHMTNIVPGKVARDKADLRVIATALTAYIMEWNGPPAGLESLTRQWQSDHPAMLIGGRPSGGNMEAYLPEIPQTVFSRNVPDRLFVLPTPGGSCVFLAWTPGPDAVFDIEPGETLKNALSTSLAADVISPWLSERTYDPTNGMLSKGDLVRLEGPWTRLQPVR